MARNKNFDSRYEPFRDNQDLVLNNDNIHGPFSFLNPTQASFNYVKAAELTSDAYASEFMAGSIMQTDSKQYTACDVEYKWTSRDNRKGRHALVIHEGLNSKSRYVTPPPSTSPKTIIKGLWRMCRYFSVSDSSFLVAIAFTSGYAVLVANAFLGFMPYFRPRFNYSDTVMYSSGALAILGCCLFSVGSTLAYLEAVNADRQGCFGWKMEYISYSESTESAHERGGFTRIVPNQPCAHPHNHQRGLFTQQDLTDDGVLEGKVKVDNSTPKKPSWRIFPPLNELRKYYVYDLAFIASTLFLCSSLIYCICAIASLVTMVLWKYSARWIRIPQLIAASGFTMSSALLMIETQKHWWRPAPNVLGWHIGLWNVIGSVGFAVTAGFGLFESVQWAEYQFGCSYLWGSWTFLVGNVLQWYEACNKHPVRRLGEA